jgi:hypothetical protein
MGTGTEEPTDPIEDYDRAHGRPGEFTKDNGVSEASNKEPPAQVPFSNTKEH